MYEVWARYIRLGKSEKLFTFETMAEAVVWIRAHALMPTDGVHYEIRAYDL